MDDPRVPNPTGEDARTFEVFERRCPTHRLVLVASVAPLKKGTTREVLTCPDGHEVETWIVADRAGVVLAFATFERVTLIAPFDPPSDFRGDGWTSSPSGRSTHSPRDPWNR
jgi:hypothetical protein